MKKIIAIILSIIFIINIFPLTIFAENNNFFEDISYGDEGERNLLDLYLPDNDKDTAGLVLYIHGGSWIAGDKNGYKTKLKEMQENGYASAAINYRYASYNTSLDDILDDVTSALKKIKDIALDKGIIINKCMLIGDSAGAHISLMYAYTRDFEAPIKVACVRGNSTPADLTLHRFAISEKTLLEISCVTGLAKNGFTITPKNVSDQSVQFFLNKYSPVSYASSAVPTILCHGSKDDGVPIEGAVKMYQQLLLAEVPVEGIVYPNSNHGLESDPDCDIKADEITNEYLEKYVSNIDSTEENPYILKNVSYGDAGERNLLDLYLPENYVGEVGLVLYIHGGGWISGSKADYDNCEETVKRGYAAATINYRYTTNNISIWDILDDVTTALSKIKELANDKGIIINKCILNGFSAGGHIALMYSYTRASESPITPVAVISRSGPTDLTDKEYKKSNLIMAALSGICGSLNYGVLINESNFDQVGVQYLLKEASPVNYISTAIPTIFCHGTKDSIVPFTNGMTLLKKISETDVPYVPITFKDSDHGLENDPEASDFLQKKIDEYEKTYLGSPAIVKPIISAKEGTDITVDEVNKVIYGFTDGLNSVLDYINIEDGYTCEDCNIATNNKLKVYKDKKLVAEFNLILFGDVNDDGICDGNDAVIVDFMANGMIVSDYIHILAADCNHDNVIDDKDVALLNRAGLTFKDINQKFVDEKREEIVYNIIDSTSTIAEESSIISIFITKLFNMIKSLLSIFIQKGR